MKATTFVKTLSRNNTLHSRHKHTHVQLDAFLATFPDITRVKSSDRKEVKTEYLAAAHFLGFYCKDPERMAALCGEQLQTLNTMFKHPASSDQVEGDLGAHHSVYFHIREHR